MEVYRLWLTPPLFGSLLKIFLRLDSVSRAGQIRDRFLFVEYARAAQTVTSFCSEPMNTLRLPQRRRLSPFAKIEGIDPKNSLHVSKKPSVISVPSVDNSFRLFPSTENTESTEPRQRASKIADCRRCFDVLRYSHEIGKEALTRGYTERGYRRASEVLDLRR